MLTDKTKEAFTDFYNKNIQNTKRPHLEDFKKLPFSMQYGIYVDFFDDNGIKIGISPIFDYGIDTRIYDLDINGIKSVYETRNKARKNAILKANILFNDL